MLTIKKIKIINSVIFLYIISLFLFTYREGFTFISNCIALILIGTIWVNFLIIRKKLVINKMLLSFMCFMALCVASSFVAIKIDLVFSKVITLGLIFILLISLVNYIDTIKIVRKIIGYYVYAGLIASVYIIVNTNFTEMTRFGATLGNVNTVGIIIGISATFSFYLFITEKQYRHIFYLAIMIPILLITGSRKSLFFIIINFDWGVKSIYTQ